jgi:hypothetical protein
MSVRIEGDDLCDILSSYVVVRCKDELMSLSLSYHRAASKRDSHK